MNKYTDSIIECPNGFALALNEMYCLGLTEFLRYDENKVSIIGINKINRFYPIVLDFYTPALVYLRGYKKDMDILTYIEGVERVYENINILIIHPAEGQKIVIGSDLDKNDIYITKDIYDALMEDPESIIIYQKYIFHPEVIDDGTGTGNIIPNPKLQQTILNDTLIENGIVDGEMTYIVETVEIPNPQYSPFKKMGYWA